MSAIVSLSTLALGSLLLLVIFGVIVADICRQSRCRKRANEQRRLVRTEATLARIHNRLSCLEQRIDLVGLPRKAADVLLFRRLIEALIKQLIESHDDADWWKRGGQEP